VEPSTNGHAPHPADDVMHVLRGGSSPALVLRGFGSLVVGVVLFVLMLWLAPSVAPEHVVERPATSGSATTTTATTAPTTTAPASTTVTVEAP
jgi:hypothetical protein